jgi:hypothetical protein
MHGAVALTFQPFVHGNYFVIDRFPIEGLAYPDILKD